ncbi:ABC transporter ATP-binding protein [Clostridiisalibacter paucivorans]|uniref:ABC transporter ATP-binding protein n=1 Tax=Clostridiisalibacter paucivorans TaxID=408753 RepID=UPI000A028F41|nr:ABC transporter ATP-binding protein [Clostridiisalibacter paucivorans]
MKKLLELKDIHKSFKVDNKDIQVLKDIDIDIEKGEFVSVLGPSGCGKSTLLEIISGFSIPDYGKVIYIGEEVSKPSISMPIVFQDFNQLFPWKSILDNILLPLEINNIGTDREDRINTVEKYLQMVGLNGKENLYPHQLSGGMKQRVAIARALSVKSDIVLMDEPFGSLDAQLRRELQDIIIDIWKDTGKSFIFVTHDIMEAIYISTKIIVMGYAPNSIRKIIDNPLGKERNYFDSDFMKVYRDIYQLLK